MGVNLNDPSVGIDAETGATLTGWSHVVQTLRDIFLTRFGSRVMREWYGSFVPEALGRNITREEIAPVIASITSAIEQWEPRFRITAVEIVELSRTGALRLHISGRYRPRALLGDMTEEGARRLIIGMSGQRVTIDQGE